jgi:hypothetical protein
MPSPRELMLMSREVYEQAENPNSNQLNSELAGKSWEIFHVSNPDETTESGFTAVTFVNLETHEAWVAFAGTDQTFGVDGLNGTDTDDDIAVAAGKIPQQFEVAERYVNEVKAQLEEQGYTVTGYTGHSFGTVLSDLSAVSDGLPSITFENPGSKPMADTLANQLGIEYDSNLFTIYNGNPNLINTTNEQIAPVNQIATNLDDTSFSYHSAFTGIIGFAPAGSAIWYTTQAHQLDKLIDATSETTGEPIVLLPNIDQRQEEIHIDFDPRDIQPEDVEVTIPFDTTNRAIDKVEEVATDAANYINEVVDEAAIYLGLKEPEVVTQQGSPGDSNQVQPQPDQLESQINTPSNQIHLVPESDTDDATTGRMSEPVSNQPQLEVEPETDQSPENTQFQETDSPIESLSVGDSSTIEESDVISASAPDENPDSIALEEPTTPALEVESDQPDMLSTEPVEGDITDGLSEQSASNVEFNQADFDGQTLVPASLDTTPTDSTFENDSAATHSELVGTEPETESPEQTLALDQPQPSMDQPGAEELSSQVNTDDASWFAENTPMLDSPVAEAQQPEVAPVLDNVLLDAPPAIEISEPETATLSGTEDFSVAPTSEVDSWEDPDSPDFEPEPLSNPNLETGAMATDTELAEVTPEVEATVEPVAFDQVQEFGGDQPSDPVNTNDVNWFAENTPMLDSPTVDAEPPEITSPDLFASTPSSFEPSETSVPNIFAETPSVFESTEPASPDVFAATPSVFNETPTQTDLFTSTPSVFESPAPSTPDVFADTPSVFETATTQTDLFTSTPSVFESGETSSAPGSVEIPSAFETTPPQTDLFVNAPSVFESVESSTPDAFANTPSVFEVPGDQTSTDLFATTPSAFEIPESSTPDVFADTPSAFEIGPETSNPFDNTDSVFDAPDVFSNVPSAFDAPGTTPANLFADTGPETNFDLSPEWSDHSLESFDSSIDFDFSSGIEDIPELSVSADAFSDYSDYSLPDVNFDTPSFDVSDYDVVTYDSPSDTSSSVDMSFPDVGSVDDGGALSSE